MSQPYTVTGCEKIRGTDFSLALTHIPKVCASWRRQLCADPIGASIYGGSRRCAHSVYSSGGLGQLLPNQRHTQAAFSTFEARVVGHLLWSTDYGPPGFVLTYFFCAKLTTSFLMGPAQESLFPLYPRPAHRACLLTSTRTSSAYPSIRTLRSASHVWRPNYRKAPVGFFFCHVCIYIVQKAFGTFETVNNIFRISSVSECVCAVRAKFRGNI